MKKRITKIYPKTSPTIKFSEREVNLKNKKINKDPFDMPLQANPNFSSQHSLLIKD